MARGEAPGPIAGFPGSPLAVRENSGLENLWQNLAYAAKIFSQPLEGWEREF